eukprot:1009387-Rhodomonas_salina.1
MPASLLEASAARTPSGAGGTVHSPGGALDTRAVTSSWLQQVIWRRPSGRTLWVQGARGGRS